MKKILLFLLFLTSLAAHAQISISPELGLNMANMSIKTSGDRISTGIKKGFTGGAMAEKGFSRCIYLQAGLFYAFNGCDVTNSGYLKIHTVQLPVSIQYKTGEPGSGRFFVGAGPYIGYNFSGTSKGLDTTTVVHIGNNKDKDDIRPIDWGIGINAGVSIADVVYIRFRYAFSVANLNPNQDPATSIRLLATSMTVGYTFGHSTPKRMEKKHKVVKKG